MRRVVILTLLALALPIAASADIIVNNQFGSISISNSGISSIGSQLRSWGAQATGGSMGTVSFSTGAFIAGSGSIATGGQFSATGSTFDVLGVGKWAGTLTGNKCGAGCSLFAGSFVGPAAWTLVSDVKGKGEVFSLTGAIQGMMWDGRMTSGTTTQIFNTTAGQLTSGIAHIHGGSTTLTVPEPGTLGLLGTGLVGIAGLFRRKIIGG